MSGVPGAGLIDLASRLVPEERRQAWRDEWEAEAVWAWQQMRKDGEGPVVARLQLWWRVGSCVVDAMLEGLEAGRMTGMGNDIRFALRGLVRRPGFTAVAVLTLALGIGATTAVFTLLDGVLLSPLPFGRSGDLLSLRHQGRDGQDPLPMSGGLYFLYRQHARTLDAIGMYSAASGNLVVNGEPERVLGQQVTPGFFEMFGVKPALGRAFEEAEGKPGGTQVVILSDGLWRTRFGAARDILGQTIDLNGNMREVIGVMPADFGYPDRTSRFWVPMVLDEANAPIAAFFANGVGRKASGQSVDGVRAELKTLLGRLPELAPGPGADFLMRVNIAADIETLKDSLVGSLSKTLWILFATVGIVLLIACANVASLLLVRAEGRQRELALRVALGAGRLQVLRAFLSESVALSVAGSALALFVASTSLSLTKRYIPNDLPRMAEIGIDARVLGFTAVVATICALFFGVFPLIRYRLRGLSSQLREGGARTATSGRDRNRLRNGLVILQVALALVLLIGSGLMLRSFQALRSVDAGFDHTGALTARVTVPPSEIPDWQATEQFYRDLKQRLESQPGVTAVAFTTGVPLGGGGTSFIGIDVEDHPRQQDELPIFAFVPRADVGYFGTMGIRVLQGRDFEPGDGGKGFRAVIVSRSFAERWWPGSSPLGRHIRFGAQNEDWYSIVGVVDDVHNTSLEEVTEDMVYFPLATGIGDQYSTTRSVDVVIRTAGDPLSFVPALRTQLHDLNPRIPIANPRTLESVFNGAAARTSFTAAMLGAASGIALLLGLVGIYGVISYVVSQRTREIGVRMALGASRGAVRGMVVRQGMALSGIGVAAGLVAAGLLSRVMGSLLFGVKAMDPLTYGSVAVSLALVALIASLIPAIRASAVDPGNALRDE